MNRPGRNRPLRPSGVSARSVEADNDAKKGRRSPGALSLSVRVLGAGAIAGLLALNLVPVGMQWYQQNQEYRAVVAQVEAAKEQNRSLQESLDAWNNDNYVASQAKSRLGYVWPGEVQYNVVGLPDTAQSGGEESDVHGTSRPWPSVLLQSMLDADSPAASEGLNKVEPTESLTESE